MVVCVHLPRFELAIAAGGRERVDRRALAGRALAIAPSRARGGGGVGEVSAAAEAHGVVPGMSLPEALVRCPQLELVAADPLGVADAWERTLLALEALGAAVQSPSPGLAFFAADGLLRLHGGLRNVIDAAERASVAGVALTPRIGAAPTAFAALAAASVARPRRGPVIVEGGPASVGRWLAARPLELLRFRAETAALPVPLRRLGLRSLADVQALGRDTLADRFGQAGATAHDLACGLDEPLRPRVAPERLSESMELDEADIGPALERVLLVLIERLLARRERDGRALRSATISARLVEGGTWRETAVFRRAIADSRRICLSLAPRLSSLPAPAESLRLEVDRFGPPLGEQDELPGIVRDDGARPLHGGEARLRRARLAEAVDQARAAAGPDAALRIVCVEPDSRVPERRAALAPFQA